MSALNIGGRLVGPGQPAWIIAELGINHDGDVRQALKMVRAAKAAGADAVKVQFYHTDCFVSHHAEYKGERQSTLFNRYELSLDAIKAIAGECEAEGITFFGTPDCEAAARWLLKFGAPALKCGSDDLTNLPLIRSFAGWGVPLILSTGMASAREIDDALAACAGTPVALLHCVSEYPCPPEHANLHRMLAIEAEYAVDAVGYSDHTDGNAASVAAVALGAQIVERHFTLDRSLPGPDHAFSADPTQLSDMVRRIREIETLLGRYDIEPSDEEKAMRVVARRSIRSRFDVPAGTLLTRGHLVFQRPGDGLPPSRLDDVLGRSLVMNKAAGDTIGVEDVR